ncbi:MAG: 30S ribosomal protein S4 [Candidatus Sumerlaeota bacterium]|nr:30S ribosomal protein S4 [Candidatus Sumerlaeota bacterium]
MARYTGPKHRLCRRIGNCLWNDPKCPSKKRPVAPGTKGGQRGGGGGRRGKMSNYARHLLEKQKLRLTYGLLEKQFKNTFKRAQRMTGVTGENFMKMLECRLDNLVYRLGFAPSIFSARQLVNHGHIAVDGQKVDIASFLVRVGQTISIREKSRKMPMLVDSTQRSARTVPAYLELKAEEYAGRLSVAPRLQDIPVQVDTNLIVEFYSR